MEFRLSTEQLEDNGYVISLAGEVDLYTSPELKRELLDIIEQGGEKVVVDLTEATFIDSTTLGVLLAGLKRLRPLGGELVLVCSDRKIKKIFEITTLDRVFGIEETRSDALARLELAGQRS